MMHENFIHIPRELAQDLYLLAREHKSELQYPLIECVSAEPYENPRSWLFAALEALSAEVGEAPGLGSTNQRMNAVISVVNALFPKLEAVQALRAHGQSKRAPKIPVTPSKATPVADNPFGGIADELERLAKESCLAHHTRDMRRKDAFKVCNGCKDVRDMIAWLRWREGQK